MHLYLPSHTTCLYCSLQWREHFSHQADLQHLFLQWIFQRHLKNMKINRSVITESRANRRQFSYLFFFNTKKLVIYFFIRIVSLMQQNKYTQRGFFLHVTRFENNYSRIVITFCISLLLYQTFWSVKLWTFTIRKLFLYNILYLQKVFFWALEKCGLHFEVPHDICCKRF